jgi:hypothetical protein
LGVQWRKRQEDGQRRQERNSPGRAENETGRKDVEKKTQLNAQPPEWPIGIDRKVAL